ncbi:uncharacterized protein EKO05_0010662 [Ascochyta rabiei]|uniref:Uncharacterized protein n=1 Tax=Didymella rabiei TaxID=5454 RepID=A0A163ATU1_DIDRA|nr:uncharacterized protein EKO05_0010662 [Ascochyta rabiei]KZM21384.1 hypothetical protein ST47_g7476 [Ascochyta rabiei]UPX20431.1 hypothetical protein EKO05_0010662 [Ascochyta rabiei]
MGEADSGTPRSTTDPPLLKAPKDKNCPFCGQAFTSSSLGRHLDLYIRPKNPKAADGIHLVDEIRKLRGGITRRQAKGSISKKDDGAACTPLHAKHAKHTKHAKHSVASEGSSTLVQSPDDEDDDHHHHHQDQDHDHDNDNDGGLGIDLGKTRGQFKDVSWGTSNRQLSRALGTKAPEMRREASRQMRKQELDQRQRHGSDVETARAAEMALRELLKSVREANVKATGCGLFDLDPYTLNFPSLCLHILPAPSTLFSPTPFPTPDSWSITPPAQKQLDALNRCVRERLLALQRQRQIDQVYPPAGHSNPASAATSPLPTPPLFDPDPQKLFSHIADAYNHWMHQSEKTRQEYWQIEILRCYARANESRRETEVQLDNARREIEYLKANRWTSGAPDVSPVSITLGAETAKELGKQGMDFRNWDFDRLIDKWRAVVREDRSVSSGMAAQKQLPDSRSCSMASLPPQSFAAVNRPAQGSPTKMDTAMPFSAPATVNGESDQVDAEGDDDDEHLDLDSSALPDDDSMHQHPPPHSMQQHHSLPLQPTPIHPSQQHHPHMQAPMHVTQAQAQASIQAHAHAQVHAQAQAQAQAWAAARQHMNQSRNQNYSPHQHQQISPHPQHTQHMGSAANSRRPSVVMMDPHVMNSGGMAGSMGIPGMEGIEGHQDQYLRMDLGSMAGFVGSNDGGVSMGT